MHSLVCDTKWTWNCRFFVLSGTHITPNSVSFLCTLCFASSLLGLLMEKMCHSRCVVWGWRTLPLSYIRYLNIESLNCLHDNSEQEVIKTKLFRMVRPRMRKNSFFIDFHIYLLTRYSSSCRQVSPHTACLLVLYYGCIQSIFILTVEIMLF